MYVEASNQKKAFENRKGNFPDIVRLESNYIGLYN